MANKQGLVLNSALLSENAVETCAPAATGKLMGVMLYYSRRITCFNIGNTELTVLFYVKKVCVILIIGRYSLIFCVTLT